MIDPAPTGRELQRGELVNYPPLMSPATRIGVGSTRPLGYSDHLVNCHDPGVSSVTCHPVRSEGMSLRLGALAVVFSVAFHAVGVHAQAGSAPWGVVAQPVGSVAVQDSGGTRSVSQAIADYRKLKKRHAPVVDVWLALDSLGQFDDPRIVDLAIEEFESEDIERYATARQLIGGLATADSLNRVLTWRRPSKSDPLDQPKLTHLRAVVPPVARAWSGREVPPARRQLLLCIDDDYSCASAEVGEEGSSGA